MAQVKTFLNWCVKKRWLRANPAATIEGIGKRRRRKPQLTLRELRKWHAAAMRLAEGGNEGAVAALLACLVGLRCSEIVALTIRSIDERDEPADVMRVFEGKTDKSRRAFEVPETLRPFLVHMTVGRVADELLFGKHWRDWPRHQVHRICDLADIPRVSAHAMRGAHATVAIESGISAHVVAAILGHEDTRTTKEHYAREGAEESAVRRKLFRLLEGGRG